MEEIKQRDTDSACECYVNAAEIQQGRWQEDPSVCLRNCKAQFLRSVAKGWGEDVGWPDGCGKLNKGVAVHDFWSLYWCDSTFCGVGINQTGGLGQDPTVDLIINTCQNIGYYSILDPGPPPPDFKCRTETSTRTGGCSASLLAVPAATPGPPLSTSAPSMPTNTTHSTATTTQAEPTPGVVGSEPTSAPPVATEDPSPTTAASTTTGSNLTTQGKVAVGVCSILALILVISLALLWLRRRKRRKASFHRTLRSRRGLSGDLPPAGSPTPLISPASSAIGTRTLLTPPLRLRDRKFLPSILRPNSRSPSPPLTPLTPAYSPQFNTGTTTGTTTGVGAIFPASPICSPTTNKLIPRHERSTVPRTTPYTSTSAGYPPLLASLTPESAFSLPIPPSPWTPPPQQQQQQQQDGNRRASGASSCYTGTGIGTGMGGGTSTAHSSLRHEIPIAIPYFAQGAAGTSGAAGGGVYGVGSSTGGGMGERSAGTPSPPPPPAAPPGSMVSVPLPLPSRPPRPHEGMLEIPDLVGPVSSSTSAVVGSGVVGSPPLSPPPTKALPRPPRGSATASPVLAPLPAAAGRSGVGKSPPPPPPPPRVLGTAPWQQQHHRDLGPPPSYSSVAIASGSKAQADVRGSWGSWSGVGPVVGSGYHGVHANVTKSAAEVEGEGAGGGSKGQAVSPRSSQSSGVTAAGETVVSAVSRMSSTREDAGGKSEPVYYP